MDSRKKAIYTQSISWNEADFRDVERNKQQTWLSLVLSLVHLHCNWCYGYSYASDRLCARSVNNSVPTLPERSRHHHQDIEDLTSNVL